MRERENVFVCVCVCVWVCVCTRVQVRYLAGRLKIVVYSPKAYLIISKFACFENSCQIAPHPENPQTLSV